MTRPEIVAIVPACNSDEALLRLVDALRGRLSVLVVDDGSEDASVFERLPVGVTVLTHAANRGKGAALKTAFRHVVEHCPDAADLGVRLAALARSVYVPASLRLRRLSSLRDNFSPVKHLVFRSRR